MGAGFGGFEGWAADGRSHADAAVVIGIEDYLAVPDVPGARQNATDWYDWFVRARGLPPSRVRLLRDGEATREVVLDEVRRLGGQVGPDGALWVVFVGHGAPALDGRDGVLVGADAQPTARQLYDRSFARGELEAAAGGGHPTVLLLDACFSGSVGGAPLVPGLQPLVPTWAVTSGGASVLVGAGAGQFAGPLPGLGRPAFSYLALGALRGWADADGDGAVTAREVESYTRETLAAVLVDRAQTPERAGPDVVLGYGAEAAPDVAAHVAALASAPPSRPSAPPVRDGLEDWLSEIWRLRNTVEGRRRVSDALDMVFPGVGMGGVVVGQSTPAAVRDNLAINPRVNCFAEGPRLKPNRAFDGLRRWPCAELRDRDWSEVDTVGTPEFVAHARAPGSPVWMLEAPDEELASAFDRPAAAVRTPSGITAGMSLAEALARVPVPPDAQSDLLVSWSRLGLELVLREGEVRVVRVLEATGTPP